MSIPSRQQPLPAVPRGTVRQYYHLAQEICANPPKKERWELNAEGTRFCVTGVQVFVAQPMA